MKNNELVDPKDLFNQGLQEGREFIEQMELGTVSPGLLIFNELKQILAASLAIKGVHLEQEQVPATYIDDTRVIGKQAGVKLTLIRQSLSNRLTTSNIAEIVLRPDAQDRNFTVEYRNLNVSHSALLNKALSELAPQHGFSVDNLDVCSKSYNYNADSSTILKPLGALIGISLGKIIEQNHVSTPRPASPK